MHMLASTQLAPNGSGLMFCGAPAEPSGDGPFDRRLELVPNKSKAPSLLRFAEALQILIFALSCSLFLAGCGKPAVKATGQPLSIDYEISPQPPRVGLATITLKISDSAGKPTTGASVKMEGNMTHAGMAPSFGTARETAPGRYLGPLDLSMGGDWIILVHLTLPGGEKVEKQFAVKGVQPG